MLFTERTIHHCLLMVIKYNRFQMRNSGLILHSKLDFNENVTNKTRKFHKLIGVRKKVLLTLNRKALIATYKSSNRPILDYTDIIYDKPLNENFKSK